MFRLHARSTDPEGLRDFAAEVAFKVAERPGSTPLVHLFNDTSDREVSQRAVEALRSVMPNCLIAGSSTSGNICNGAFTNNPLPNLTAFCDIYEDPTTRVEVIQVDLDEQTRRASTRNILESLSTRPWVRAVEMLTTIIDVDMHAFCTDLNRANPDVVFFGGGALSRETINMFLGLPYVFSSAGDASGHAVVMVLYGGPNFHVTTEAVIGWRTLGRHLEVTKAEGPIVYELDHRPAYELYHHYLSIENDEQFDRNSLIFPLVFDHNGHDVVKAPVRVGEGGSLVLTSSVGADDRSCRLAYGDPAIILKTIKRCTRTISEFFPDAILSFSCAGRFTYWGEDFISRETLPFQAIAPTDGFYTGSEFGRWNGPMLQHNLTLVLAAIREGDKPDGVPVQAPVDDAEFDRQMAIVSKLAAFVGVTSTELESAYAQMRRLATTDGLTGILNRGEMEKRMRQLIPDLPVTGVSAYEPSETAPCIVMIDLDKFKSVNDIYGHKAGDEVLVGMGEILRELVDEAGIGQSARWGGEEFMALLTSCSIEDACEVANAIRVRFSQTNFMHSGLHTLSAGVAKPLQGESVDLVCQRVDKALYAAKKNGRNCVVVA